MAKRTKGYVKNFLISNNACLILRSMLFYKNVTSVRQWISRKQEEKEVAILDF